MISKTFKIILNSPINKEYFLYKWSIQDILICADGGLNHLYNLFINDKTRQKFTPNYVIGDLDSVNTEILKFYQ
jgi:thiamine pyrophosphokinase